MIEIEPNFDSMKKDIDVAGGLFYQYRPCRRDVATIYDIENIRHGVVYAQTPLNMNDPFDSMIGFSSEKMCDEVIDWAIDVANVEEEKLKILLGQLIKYKLLGRTAELLLYLKDIKRYINTKQIAMHQTQIPIRSFIMKNIKQLYLKSPKHIKNLFVQESFLVFSLVVAEINMDDITEETLVDMLKLDDLLDSLYKQVVDIRDNVYIPQFRDFLSQLTVSCFSASGWNNQLMWSHYANSYSGICIEYDFSKITEFIGFIYPVEYKTQRPNISLKELGLNGIDIATQTISKQSEPNMAKILSYLLVKNKCWEYEDEWRIINIGEPNTPKFVEMPYIKSITLGLNVDVACKLLLWDVCQEKGIPCYALSLSTDGFVLDRKLLTKEDFRFDIENETTYFDTLIKQITNISQKLEESSNGFDKSVAEGNMDFSYLRPMLVDAIDFMSNAYYLKLTVNRICDNSDEDLTSFQIDENVLNNIKLLNKVFDEMKENATSLQDSVPNLKTMGYITADEYPRVKKYLFDILELAEKYNNTDWNSIFCIEKTEDSQTE